VIDVPVPPDAKPAIGNIPSEAQTKAGTFAPGSPWTICITPGPNQVLYSADAWPGRIYKLSLDGKLLGMLGLIAEPEGPTFISYKVARSRLDRLRFVTRESAIPTLFGV
jgi:hypothetical protein